jgi:large subunit ribosomal protein L24
LGIALILALLAALVGPHFVNWTEHRAFFEAEASRLIGLKVKVNGPIDVGVLPFPQVTLGGIEIGPPGEAARLRARTLRIELGLGPLMRGEIRAVEMKLQAPEFSIGLNSLGQVDWPAMALATDTLSIDRLSVDDGRVVLTDATSNSRLVIERLWFSGEVRSLTGPIRGNGAFAAAGAIYGYRIAAGRAADDGIKIKLSIDDSERRVSVDADGVVAFERNSPRFDGSLALSRPAASVLPSGDKVVSEPWQLTGKVTASAQSALFQQLALQYGPDERAAKLAGTADFRFGERPRLQGALSARQVDLDRLVATPDTPRRLPLAAIQSFAEMFNVSLRPALRTNLTLSIDAVTLGGSMLQGFGADLRSDGEAWHLDKLEFRAPGFTHVSLSGRLDPAAKALGFTGAASVEADDPKALAGWLAGRTGVAAQVKPWQARGEITLAADRIAVERLKTEFERGTIEGRVAYLWPVAGRPARLEAELGAQEIDLDAVLGFGESALSGLGLEWPREVALGIEIGRVRIAGFEARKAAARLKFDTGGIAVERFSLADFGNATVEASGRIDTSATPGGNIVLDLDARELDGVLALAEKFASPLADPLRQLAGRQKTAKLRATVSLATAGSGNATGKLALAGRIGAFRVDLNAGATGKPESFAVTDLSALTATDARLEGKLETDDGAMLLALLGLDRLAGNDQRPARLSVVASGPLSRDLRIDGRLAAGPLQADGKGVLRWSEDRSRIVDLEQISGTLGGSRIAGKLAVKLSDAAEVTGRIETDALDAPAVIASAIGMPTLRGRAAASGWSPEPFVPRPSSVAGRIEFKAQRATFSPTLVATAFSGALRFGPSQLVFDEIAGELARGRLEGRLAFTSSSDGLTAQGRVALSGADAGAVTSGDMRSPVTGRLTFQAEVAGTGLSPAAFIGSLAGSGRIALDEARLTGLNPRVFDAVIRAVEIGISTDANRIREFVTSSLDNGHLPVAHAEAALSITGGQLRLVDAVTRTAGADLAVTANVDLANATLDALLTLTGAPPAPDAVRPVVEVALKGPLGAPKRSIDSTALASWLALRAVEQQSRRLDAMERSRAPEPALEQTNSLPPPSQARARPEEIPAREAVPPLPPPVNIQPLPRPRAVPRADTAVAPSAAHTVPPRPSAPRSAPAPGRPLNLLGAQN